MRFCGTLKTGSFASDCPDSNFSERRRQNLKVVTHVLPYEIIDVREYNNREGQSPYAAWFDSVNAEAAAKVATDLTRLAGGNFSNLKGVGSGVFEYRIDFGPGYKVYFCKDGERLVILLGGGSKKRQERDISEAIDRWP